MLPFISLQARLGRKSPSAAIQAEVPVIFVAFDVLALGPGDERRSTRCSALPLEERRGDSTGSTCRWPATAAGSPARTWSRPPTTTPSRPPSPMPAGGATRG